MSKIGALVSNKPIGWAPAGAIWKIVTMNGPVGGMDAHVSAKTISKYPVSGFPDQVVGTYTSGPVLNDVMAEFMKDFREI